VASIPALDPPDTVTSPAVVAASPVARNAPPDEDDNDAPVDTPMDPEGPDVDAPVDTPMDPDVASPAAVVMVTPPDVVDP
jgi:hypothetical protein